MLRRVGPHRHPVQFPVPPGEIHHVLPVGAPAVKPAALTQDAYKLGRVGGGNPAAIRQNTWSRFFLLSVFQMSQKPLWQVTIRDDRLNSHVPDFLFTRFHNGSCHPFFLCGCRFFPRGIMVCYLIGKAISITTMNYSVAIFVYSRMIRYPDNAITELRYSRISK